MSRVQAHGTAIKVGETGLVFIGPPGAGKSSLALQTLFSARMAGHFAALVSDDQLFLEAVDGGVRAVGPASIAGMIELRGSGIGRVASIPDAMIHHAIRLVETHAGNRIPEENQYWRADGGIVLPMLFLDRLVRDPYPWLEALIDGFPLRPFVPDGA
ncbi:MAG: serine/threonine protein kinase [Rhizobiaceae bacterium]|nr:serine/threonine protein kinase [Rhizobiaceae bacterium]